MKKLFVFTLTLFFALSITACSDNILSRGAALPSSSKALTLPTTTKPSTNALQGDTGSTYMVGDEQTLRRKFEKKNSPHESRSSSDTEDTQNISVDITATNAYLINVDTNSVLYQKNSDEYIAPASTAKMLTALTVLDYCSLDDTFKVGSEIALVASDSSRAWLNLGDTLTVKQLLVAMLLPSGNDAAYTLAVNVGKKITGKDELGVQQAISVFVNAMNQKALEVGATSSNFTTPDGYDADGQHTTTFDLSQIAKACLGNDVLSKIMGSYKISDTWGTGREVTYTNTNELIDPNSQYYYSDAVGLKTGTTGNAGSCLVSAAYIDGQTYICVVMGSSAGIRFTDTLAVFNAIDPTISLKKANNTAHSVAPGGLRRR